MKLRKKVYMVYQDCAMCGARKDWGEAQLKLADKMKFQIVKKPFYHKDAGELVNKALQAGIGRMPFFTDGEKFVYDLADFKEKKPKTMKKKRKTSTKTKKMKKEVKDGDTTNAK